MTATAARDTGNLPPDWASLCEVARETIIRTIGDRMFARLVSDIETTSGRGTHNADILLAITMRLAHTLAETPPDGLCDECWRQSVAGALNHSTFHGAAPPPINGSALTRDLSIAALKDITEALSRAGASALHLAAGRGASRESLVAAAIAGHSIQIASGVLERAGIEGWDADDALQALVGLFRVIEALVRDGLARGPAIGEVMGHA